MYLLTLLAFYFHQVFELTDGFYQACREKFGSKRYMWESFRGDLRRMIFDSWVDARKRVARLMLAIYVVYQQR